jgi:hypothetical protein
VSKEKGFVSKNQKRNWGKHSMYLISDDRTDKEFKRISFCGYEKKELMKALKQQLKKQDPLTVGKWVAEAHASGWVGEIFEMFELFAVQEIGIGNPRLIPYLSERREEVRKQIQGKQSFLQTRNEGVMRFILSEIGMVLIQSQRRPLPKLLKFKESDLDQTEMVHRLSFYGKDFQEPYWDNENDPGSLKGVFNEMIGSLRVKQLDSVLFWVSWIRMWEQMGGVMPIKDAPDHCPLTLKAWFGWKVWRILRKEVPIPLVEFLFKMSIREIRASNSRFREDCLVFTLQIACETVDETRPLVGDLERITRECSSEVTDRIYRELVNERDGRL